ncbi:MAG: HPr-rel-A system PqqD family peptide chaperone [Methylococcales bacterium]
MPEKIWRIVPGLAIETACFDHQLIVFNKLSGDTHLLNYPVDWVLGEIGSSSRSLNELIGLAIEADIVSDNKDNRELFTKLLDNLEKLDLLESGPVS